jgi:hypothetical protein
MRVDRPSLPSAIIRILASNSPFLKLPGVPGLKKAASAILVLFAAGAVLISCGKYNSSSSTNQRPSSGTFRVFVSNPLFTNGTSTAPVLNVVDALKDLLLPSVVSVGSASPDPGLMVLFPNKRFTLVFSASNNSIVVVSNAAESLAQNSSQNNISITLPGSTESIVVTPDNAGGYAAVPNAPVIGQAPGLLQVLDLSNGAISAGVPVSGARYVAQSHNGNRLLVFGNRPRTVTVIAPSSIGTAADPRTDIQNPLFDHPVWAAFSSDDSTAYILSCGPECGGTAASVTALDMNTNPPLPGPSIPVDAGTIGLLSGNTLYVAGTKPGANCSASSTPTLATACGEVSVVDLGSGAVTATATITDGFHTRMEMGVNSQLFIGARTCTNLNVPASGSNSGEIRGCLSIFNITKSTVVVPAVTGNVTGIQPISNRSVVYVAQSGEIQIYDTTTDKPQTTQVDIIGQAVDVKQVD